MAAALEGDHPRTGSLVPFTISAIIVISAIAQAIETVKGLPDWLILALTVVEIVALILFAVEYLLRLVSAQKALRYATSFWGIVDLLAFLPTLLFIGFDALALRLLRILRVLRLLKLARYAHALEWLGEAMEEVRDELLAVLLVAGIVLYLAAVGIYHFEHLAQPEVFGSIPQSTWWALVTLTTVGYGDAYPITTGGQIFTSFILLIGLGIVALPTGLIARALMAKRQREYRHRHQSTLSRAHGGGPRAAHGSDHRARGNGGDHASAQASTQGDGDGDGEGDGGAHRSDRSHGHSTAQHDARGRDTLTPRGGDPSEEHH